MELDKYSEITDLNFDGENPHIAICHKSQGYSANLRHDAILFKSEQPINSEIIKSLEGIVDQKTITKMSFNNKRRMLEEALEEYISNTQLSNEDCYWVYVQDFNDSMVVFNHHGTLYAIDYQESGETVSLTGEPVEVSHKDLYVNSETGDELVKAVSLLKSNPLEDTSDDGESAGETEDTPLKQEKETKEENMSTTPQDDNKEVSTEELMKSAAVQELLQKAVADAVAKKEKEIEKANLTKSTTELVKGFSFVKEDDVETLVKSVIANDEGTEIIKALSAAQEKIQSLEEEVVKTKEEFGKKQAVDADVEDKQTYKEEDRAAQLQKAVQAQLAKKSK